MKPRYLPVTVVSDGCLIRENLERSGKDQQWVEITAKVSIKHNRVYNKKGPVLNILSLTPGTPPE